MEIYCKSIEEIKSLFKSGEITVEEINKDILNKIEKNYENYSTLNPRVLSIAKELDKDISSGQELKSLSGIPMAVEDSISTKGILTQNGSKILEGYIPIFDATAVERLYNEEAILIGKSKVGEFGIKDEGNIYGTAKAVLDGEAVFGISLDTSGEVRLSGAEYGLFGFRPTYGLISRYGILAHASSLDQIGITSKNIDDLSLVLKTLAEKDRRDSTSVSGKEIDYKKARENSIEGFKIGVPREYFEELKEDEKGKIEKLIQNLEKLKVKVEYIDIPSLKYSKAAYEIISSAEFSSNTARYDGISYGYRAKEYEGVDGLYKNTRTQGFGLKVKEKILFGNFVIGEGQYEVYYERAQRLRTRLKEEFENVFKKYDLILTHVDEDSTLGSNLGGLPSMAIPYSSHMENPLGFQIIGDKFQEEKLLNFAYNYEREVLKQEVVNNG